MSFRVYTDGIFGGIQASDEDPDGFEVFATFTAARRDLVDRMVRMQEQYRESAAYCRRLKLADVES